MWIQFDWKSEPARLILKERHGIKLAERTLSKYKKELREMYKSAEDDSDSVVDWSDFAALEKHGVPQIHLNALHTMWEISQKMHILDDNYVYLKPTYRFLRWCAYILEYYNLFITEMSDIQFVADQYCSREIIAQYSGHEMVREDLDYWLIFRPWLKEENMMEYIGFIEQGKIPPLNLGSSIWDIDIAESIPRPELIERAKELWYKSLLVSRSPVPYLLPSQIMKNYMGRIIEELEQEQADKEELSSS